MSEKPNPPATLAQVWDALGHGTHDPSCVGAYLEQMLPRLRQILESAAGKLPEDDLQMLRNLNLVVYALHKTANGGSEGWEYKLEFKRRKRGKPIDRRARAKRGNDAAAKVSRLVAAGVKQEAAVEEASAETGLSRSEIFEHLAIYRDQRPQDPLARISFVRAKLPGKSKLTAGAEVKPKGKLRE